jgi:hypothetical protein
MVGLLGGFLIALMAILIADVSWWWALWGSLIGLVLEILTRLGCGAEGIDAVGDAFTSFGSFGGGDGGGGCSSCGSGCGGGGGD